MGGQDSPPTVIVDRRSCDAAPARGRLTQPPLDVGDAPLQHLRLRGLHGLDCRGHLLLDGARAVELLLQALILVEQFCVLFLALLELEFQLCHRHLEVVQGVRVVFEL
ncbi:MAG: hypothetical protein VX113_09825, partial [Pseudomonadota bacterium]|nr:hypothetical protein [Pseudomonadota bacterium]